MVLYVFPKNAGIFLYHKSYPQLTVLCHFDTILLSVNNTDKKVEIPYKHDIRP